VADRGRLHPNVLAAYERALQSADSGG
jgi:hypothetical protein